MERCALLARLKAYPTSTVFIRLQTIMDAASLLASSWTCQSSSIYMSALGTTPPPTNGIAWKCLLPCVKHNTCAADTALWNLAIIANRALTWYPPPPLLQDQRRRKISTLYFNIDTTPAMLRVFGRIRAGAKALPWPNNICPACGNANGGTVHILRTCNSTAGCRSALMRKRSVDTRRAYCALADKDFILAVFNVEQMDRQMQRDMITFVWDAIGAARQTVICRRDSE